MADDRTSLMPIDLSTLPDLGKDEQDALAHELERLTWAGLKDVSKGSITGLASAVVFIIGLTIGADSIVVLPLQLVMLAVSFITMFTGAFTAIDGIKQLDQAKKRFNEYRRLTETQPLAGFTDPLRAIVEGWNDRLEHLTVSYEQALGRFNPADGRQVAHLEALEAQFRILSDEKGPILDLIERMRPVAKLLTPAE